MFKRLFCTVFCALAAAALLSACGAGPSASSSGGPAVSSSAPPPSVSSSTSSSASPEDPVVPEPSVSVLAPVVDPEPLYINPLTGEGTDTDRSANRPVAIMLNNLEKALPQCGVSQADLIYEAPAEGGITRMMAVFQSLDEVGILGSVRSARPYYVELALGLDAIFIHAGGSDDAYSVIKKNGTFNIDGVNGPYGGTMFYRDADRKKNVGFEHSLFTTGERIQKLLSGSLAKKRQTHPEGYSLPLTFAKDAAPVGGQSANTISVKYSASKTGLFDYDPEQKVYLVTQKMKKQTGPYADGNNGQQVAVTNVLVLYTDANLISGDSAGRLTVRMTGSGKGWFACGGQYVPITWSKDSATAPLCFFTADGQPLTLGVGKTYINIVGNSYAVNFE